jgi:hypothetical protein
VSSVSGQPEDSEQKCKFKTTTKSTLDDTSNATWLNIHQYLVAIHSIKVNGGVGSSQTAILSLIQDMSEMQKVESVSTGKDK